MAAQAFKGNCYKDSARAYGALAQHRGFNLTQSERDSLARWARRALFFHRNDPRSTERCSIEIDIVGSPAQDSALDGNMGERPPVQE